MSSSGCQVICHYLLHSLFKSSSLCYHQLLSSSTALAASPSPYRCLTRSYLSYRWPPFRSFVHPVVYSVFLKDELFRVSHQEIVAVGVRCLCCRPCVFPFPTAMASFWTLHALVLHYIAVWYSAPRCFLWQLLISLATWKSFMKLSRRLPETDSDCCFLYMSDGTIRHERFPCHIAQVVSC